MYMYVCNHSTIHASINKIIISYCLQLVKCAFFWADFLHVHLSPSPYPSLGWTSLTNSWNPVEPLLDTVPGKQMTGWCRISKRVGGNSLKIILLMQDVCCHHSHANFESVQETASTGKLIPLLQLQVSGRNVIVSVLCMIKHPDGGVR